MPRTPTPPRKRPQPQQDTQNSMFFFRKTDEKLPEPKRLTRKDLEDQVASLNDQLSTAENEKTKAERSSADAQHVLKILNDVLKEQVAELENTCGSLQGQLERKIALEKTCRRLQAKNEQKAEQLNKLKDLHEKNLKEREKHAYLAFEGVNVQLIAANKSLLEQRETVASLKIKLDKSMVTARSVLKLHMTNKSLEEENKHLKVAYENIGSEMEKLKQTTEEEIVRCKTECEQTIKKTLNRERAILSSKLIEGECYKAAATEKFLKAFKKRKLEDVRSVVEQSSAGASLPIADVVPCECDNGDRCVHDESVHQQPSSD